jgi:Fur family zinc uptake transcriptional regulator
METAVPPANPIWNRAHDHQHCIDDALDNAARLCTERGARLTRLRRRVLELVWGSHRPIGAYALLDSLRAGSGRAAPATIYRALEFLLAQGLVHRIESRNAYIGCSGPEARHGGQFLICRDCGEAVELNDSRISSAIGERAEAAGFQWLGQMIEVVGLCPGCRQGAANG